MYNTHNYHESLGFIGRYQLMNDAFPPKENTKGANKTQYQDPHSTIYNVLKQFGGQGSCYNRSILLTNLFYSVKFHLLFLIQNILLLRQVVEIIVFIHRKSSPNRFWKYIHRSRMWRGKDGSFPPHFPLEEFMYDPF